jgi:hypothetical protein
LTVFSSARCLRSDTSSSVEVKLLELENDLVFGLAAGTLFGLGGMALQALGLGLQFIDKVFQIVLQPLSAVAREAEETDGDAI